MFTNWSAFLAITLTPWWIIKEMIFTCEKRKLCRLSNVTLSVLFRCPPSYNPKRRSALGWLHRAPSLSTLALPPSPCPSDRSSAPFSSASSSMSDGSAPPCHETDTASIVTGTAAITYSLMFLNV